MKNSFFDSLFLVNFRFSLRIFCVFERVSCVAFYIEKIGVWNSFQMKWDSFQTSTLMQRTYLS